MGDVLASLVMLHSILAVFAFIIGLFGLGTATEHKERKFFFGLFAWCLLWEIYLTPKLVKFIVLAKRGIAADEREMVERDMRKAVDDLRRMDREEQQHWQQQFAKALRDAKETK